MQLIGIYRIINIANGKSYIGSSRNIRKRFYMHLWQLRKGKHHSKHLQRAWNFFGDSEFYFAIIEYCEIAQLIEREQYWVNYFKTFDSKHGYNLSKIVNHPGTGKITDAYRKKMSEIKKGIATSALQKQRAREVKRKLTDEDEIKIKELFKSGMNMSDIAKLYSFSDVGIRNVLKRHGLKS